MAGQSTIFPIFLRAEYSDSTALQRFQSDAQRAAQAVSGEIKKVGAAFDGIFARRGASGGLNLGVGQLKTAIDAQRQLAIASREVADATKAAATANGGFDAALSRTAKAAFDNARAQEVELAALQAKLPLLERVQVELAKNASASSALTGENLRLAQAEAAAANGATMLAAIYRGTAAEIGRVANSARESASAFELLFQAQDAKAAAAGQAFFNTAAGLDRQTKSARESASAFEALFAEQERAAVAARRITDSYLALAQAEAAAVNGANMISATLRGTALEQDRVTKSARESAAAFEEAFAAQTAKANAAAAALASLKAQINPTAVAQEQFNQKVAFAKGALDRGELSQKEYAQAVRLASAALREAGQAEVAAAAARNGFTTATRAGTTARGNVINSIRSERTAFIQLGQQLQDITVQAQLGTNAFIIMGQQLPQAAFALTGLANSADKTKAAVGRVATFLAGPWGAAVFVALAVLGPFVQKLFESKEAADESGRAQRSLAEVLIDTSSSYKEVTKALDDYNRAQRNAQQTTLSSLQQQAAAIAANLKEAISIREKTKARIADLLAADQNLRATGDRGAFGFGADAAKLQSFLSENETELRKLIESSKNTSIQVATAIADINSDSTKRINAGFDELARRAKATITDVTALTNRLTQIEKDRSAALAADRSSRRTDRSADVAARRRAAEIEQLADLGERAAEQVQRINERFSDSPRLITQAAQASRRLNAIVADINKELATSKNLTADQRKEFEAIKTAAADAQETIGNALLRPFQDLRRESDQRLQIERLIAQGRDDEAAGLQEVFRIEQQLGTEAELRLQVQRLIADKQEEEAARLSAFIDGYKQLKDEAAARVAGEQRVTRELRAQRELLELQADVARTVADSLRDLLSGRSTDFFGNFKRAIQDLQGARLFEQLFGKAFRDIEEQLRGNTPQGRANARAAQEIETFADTGKFASEVVINFADAVSQATSRILGGPDAANDNQIIVRAKRPEKQEIATKSIKDIVNGIAKATVAGFLGPLEDVLGVKFFEGLSNVLSGALAGYIRGGTTGGILGALESVTKGTKGLEKLSVKLGKAGDGAAVGTTVNAISKKLGLPSSKTGAQIGGALGSAFGPTGQIIGSILGNTVGGLLKKTPRGSANLTGAGQFTLSGNNKGGAQDTAASLAGQVSDQLRNLAKQLGATLGSFAVSIGVSGDSFHVDTSGQGRLKKSQGGFDFNQDAEAAIAFAIADAVKDGAIKGLSAAANRLLQSGKDIGEAVQDVLNFKGVFDQLKAIKDPVGAAIQSLNTEFESLIELFTRAGASTEEFASLEELYNIKRADAIKDASDRVVGSLRQLLDDLKIGDSGLSLRDRQSNALTKYNSLAARVAAGDTSAFDEFADVSKQLLDIERQLFGSTQSYFDRLAQVTTLTEDAINRTTAGTTNGSTAPNPFDERAAVVKSIDASNAEQVGWLKAINDNLIALNPAYRAGGGGGSSGGGAGSEYYGDGYGRVLNF